MVYNNNFVVVLKHKGRILRDTNSIVNLPFGAEYSVLLKNKDSRQAVADIEVDGKDALGGSSIIVPGKGTVELKGFMRGRTVRNKFKFIEKTDQISRYRGDRIDDGLVSVEYKFEKQPDPTPYWATGNNFLYNMPVGSRAMKSSGDVSTTYFTSTCDSTATYSCNVANDAGITVDGSETNQNFNHGFTQALEEQSSVITLQIKGYTTKHGRKKKVRKPLVVAKVKCSTCGKQARNKDKYCGRCGTYVHR